jgi:hypothetical protein
VLGPSPMPGRPGPSGPEEQARRMSASMAAWEYLGLTLEEFALRWWVGEYDGRSLPAALRSWVEPGGVGRHAR